MNGIKRPLAITALACLYIAVGAIGFIAHFPDISATSLFRFDGLAIGITELLAVVTGLFLLRGSNWARWVALAWIAFHVVISALNAFHEFVVHALFCAAIAWLLFRPDAARYFRHSD